MSFPLLPLSPPLPLRRAHQISFWSQNLHDRWKSKAALVIMLLVPTSIALRTANRWGGNGHVTSSDTGQNKMEWAEPCALLSLLSTKLKIINSLVSSFPSPEKKKKWLTQKKVSKVIHGRVECWERGICVSRDNNMIWLQENSTQA